MQLDPKGLEAAIDALLQDGYSAAVPKYAEIAIAAYLEVTGKAIPPGWPDPLESPQAEAIRAGKLDDTEIRNLFDTMERELRLHRERTGEAKPVAVKPLEWIAEGDASFAAKSLAGSYVIGKDEKGGKGWQWGFVGDPRDWVISEFFPTSDEAKAAAQADYERLVLSCLAAPVPATPAQEVTVPREEVERVVEIANRNEQSPEGDMLAARLSRPTTDTARPLNSGEVEAALEAAREFIADQYRDDTLAPVGEWLSPEAKPTYEKIVAALAALSEDVTDDHPDVLAFDVAIAAGRTRVAALSSAPSTPEGWREKEGGRVRKGMEEILRKQGERDIPFAPTPPAGGSSDA